MLEHFRQLFQGGELGYGEWHPQRGPTTHRGAVPAEAYERHLNGETGLGLVPVKGDGTCLFGAIDLDVDDVDHVALYLKVKLLELPLNVCRSKSGGAHLYLFTKQPLPAARVVETLRRWSTQLGLQKPEIFPKQLRLAPDNVGNWINLPYFASDRTTRYAVNEGGAMTLRTFLESISYFERPEATAPPAATTTLPDGPPCLGILTSQQLREGTRNVVLFNMGVYYRKAHGDQWEDKLREFNEDKVVPVLPKREMDAIVTSLHRSSYQYTCTQHPLSDCCIREVCEKRQFGIRLKAWDEEGAFNGFAPKNLRKILTNPPHYVLSVNERDLKLSFEELHNFGRLRARIISDLNEVVQPLKQRQWEQHLNVLLVSRMEIMAPSDASLEGLVREKVYEFFETRANAISNEDILRGIPIQVDESVLFRASDLQRYLLLHRITLTVDKMFSMLQAHGCTIKRFSVAGKAVEAWAYPANQINEQHGDFTVPKFDVEEEL